MSRETQILREVYTALREAEKKHGPQMDLPLGCSTSFAKAAEYAKSATDRAAENGTLTWMQIAMEEAMECFGEDDLDKIRAEALQASAMFAKMALVVDYQRQANGYQTGDSVWTSYCGWGRGRVVTIDDTGLGITWAGATRLSGKESVLHADWDWIFAELTNLTAKEEGR